jgi:DNA-binding MarR family transcriptional regulator
MVALDEGQGVNAYARAFGMHRAKMSRYLRDIGRMARNGGPGLGLVAVEPHPNDPVRSQVFLTAKGRGIADAVFAQLQRLSASEQTITTSSKKDRRGNRSSNHRSGRFGRRGQSLT